MRETPIDTPLLEAIFELSTLYPTYNMPTNLSKEQAQEMVDNYAATIKQGLPAKNQNGKDVTDQTKWVWFPKWQLEKVLEAFSSQPSPLGEDGIKFYLGVYGENSVRGGSESIEPYIGLQTLIMVPSYKDTDGKIIDLNAALHRGAEQDPPVIENNGSMCPPTCSPYGDEFS